MDLVILVPLFFITAALAPASAFGFGLGPPEDQSNSVPFSNTFVDLDVSTMGFTYPVVLEPEVIRYLERFSTVDQQTMASWLSRIGLYEEVILAELSHQKCPSELIAVAMIESGFFPDAFSRAGAVGLWQFMLPTARAMGARVDDWVDERRHVQASTRLAARLLKQHLKRFGSWHLALAAYNAGDGAVSRAVRAAGTNDFWEISRLGLLPAEAQNYVPKAIAAMIILRAPNLVGLDAVVTMRPAATSYVSVSGGTDLLKMAKAVSLDLEEILSLNPHLRRAITPPDGEDFALMVPTDKKELIQAFISRSDEEGGEVFEPIVVRFGERIEEIAWRRRQSVRRLRLWNGLRADMTLAPGQHILVPASSDERPLRDRSLVTFETNPFRHAERVSRFYPILYAQPLMQIADWFGVTANEIRLWNGLSDENWVPAGLALRLWLRPEKIPKHSLFVAEEEVRHTPSDRSYQIRRSRPSAARRVIRHRIRKGDNLWKLSQKYRTPVDEIRRENGFGRRANLRIGRDLKVPIIETAPARGEAAKRRAKPTGGGSRYTVRAGDSLWKLSKRFRTTVKKLRRLNRLSPRAKLRVGQRIKVPGR